LVQGGQVIAVPYESPDGAKVDTFGAGQPACEFGFPLFERLDDRCGGPRPRSLPSVSNAFAFAA